jgi:hypothetical protein
MSIRDEINRLCEERRLYRLRPILPIYERREIYVSEEVDARISGPWADGDDEVRCGRAHNDLLAFTYRDPIVIARDARKGGSSYMSRLSRPEDEVWDIRCVDPKPGVRVLGRFADQNVFIGLTWEIRLLLKDFESREWRDAKLRCTTAWNHLFHVYPPLKGDYFANYITDAVFDRDC